MFKKWFSIALTLMLLCSSCALAVTEKPVVDFASLEGVIKYDEPIEISFARSMDSTTTIDENNPALKSYTENRWVDTFKEALNIDLTFDWISTDGDSNDAKWGAAIASGNVPDAGIVSNAVYQQLLEADMVADMTDIYEKEANAIYKSLNTPEVLGNLTSGGRLYGLPAPGNKYIGNAVLFVRTDWLEKLNLEMPKTIDDVIAIARAFKEAKLGGEDTIGLMFADGSGVRNGHLQGFMNGYGAYRNIWVEDAEGKLAWSNTLPEMREALLALQALYAEGLINPDFAVTNGTVSQEYVASGKCGIFYATDFAVTGSMQSCVELDPSANFACLGILGLTEDQETKIQTGAISVSKLFVSKDCKNPEAIVRMINLHCTLSLSGNKEWYDAFEADPEVQWYKLLPWNGIHFQSAINDISYANSIRDSRAAGEIIVSIPSTYNTVAKMWIVDEGDPWWYHIIGGEGGAYTYDYDMYMSGRMIPDAFNGLPTETMGMLGDVVNDALNTAMLEVIMGADISTYDEAVKTWFATGGQMITDEVNEWYASK